MAQYGGRLGNSCSPRVSFFVSIVLKKKTKKVGAILKGCVWWHNRAAGWAKKFSKNIFFVNFCSVYVPKKIKKSLVAISKGYVWWHNRAAGWAIAVTQFPATPLQPMHTKQFQTFFNCF